MIRPSHQTPHSVMSKATQDLMSQRQMHGFEASLGTLPTAALGHPLPGVLHRYPRSEALEYTGAYFSHSLCGQDGGGGEPPSTWSPSIGYLGNNSRNGGGSSNSSSSQSPLVTPAITEGSITSPFAYRQDKGSPHRDLHGPPLTTAQELAAKRRHAATGYHLDRSQGKCGSPSVVTPSVVVRHSALAGVKLSPQADSPVGLAIPKAVYGPNACCLDSHCTVGHGYNSEDLGLGPRTPTNIYEDEWLMGYGAMPLAPQRKELDMLFEQRDLRAGPGAEKAAGKEIATEDFCDLDTFLNCRVSVYGDAGQSSYSCTSSVPFIGVPPETCRSQPFPSREYSNLPPSHQHIYDPATLAQYGVPRKAYPEYPHTERYMQVPLHSKVYGPSQDHVEKAKSPRYTSGIGDKYSERTISPSPSLGRQIVPHSPAQYPLPQHIPSMFANSPAHCRMQLPGHPFAPRSFEHPTFQSYPLHLNGVHPRTAALRPPLHSLTSRHHSPLDFSIHRSHAGSSPNQYLMHPTLLSGVVPLTPHTPHTPERSNSKLNHAGSVKAPPGCYMGAPQFPVNINGKMCDSDKKVTSDLKEHYAHLLDKALIKRKLNATDKISSGSNGACGEEDVYEVEVTPKKKKMDNAQEASASPKSSPSPPMPVIEQVFSLAPYKIYLEAAGVLPPIKRCRSADAGQQPPSKPKQDPEILMESAKSDSCNSQPVDFAREKIEMATVKIEKVDAVTEVAVENSLCDRNIVKRECCDAMPGDAGGEQKSPQKPDLESDRRNSVVGDGANTAKCKDEVSSKHPIETTPSVHKDSQDSECLIKSVVKPSLPPTTPKPAPSPSANPIRVNLQNIPPHCLKLTTYNIVLPEILQTSVRPAHISPPVLNPLTLPAASQSPAEPSVSVLLRQARHQLMEMHQSLCRLLYDYATQTPPTELQDWLSKMEIGNKATYPPDKHQRITSLVGAKAREVWEQDSERSLALQKVLSKLKGYDVCGECPFPHVIRAGSIFIPMLVVKEGLFPQVHGTFVDQVLQEHRVELRPTTLSEEKHLAQLQKRSCSSKLRRLLSLRHLPDIYADVLNLFFFTSVCKVLDLVPDVSIKTEPEDPLHQMGDLEHTHYSSYLEESPPDSIKRLQEPLRICDMVKQEPEERNIDVPSGSVSGMHGSPHREEKQKMVEEDFECMEEPKRLTIVNSLAGEREELVWEVCSGLSSMDSKEELNIKVKVVPEEQEVQQQEKEREEEEKQELGEDLRSSWGGPVSSDDTCSRDSDAETSESDRIYTPSCDGSSTTTSSSVTSTQRGTRNHSGVVLKLRKVLSNGGAHGSQTIYQAVSDLNESVVEGRGELQGFQEECCRDGDRWRKRGWEKKLRADGREKGHKRELDESEDQERRRRRRRREHERRRKRKERSRSKRKKRRRERVLQRRALSPLNAATTTTQISEDCSFRPALPKIRYCPYLSTCHRTDRHRRWVLRSAVLSARQAIQHATFPDLVGKHIRHLYEEKDKSEEWYRGIVLRVHEPHPNPLKTVFEVKYDSEPEWRYYLELLVDYQKGWLKVEEDF